MSSGEVDGITKEEMLKRKHEHPDDHRHEFSDFYCLVEIPRQPEEYDGPPRFCINYTLKKEAEGERHNRCRLHNGAANDDSWESGIEAADGAGEGNGRAIKHGMYAEDENFKANWSDADQKVYDKIMEWAEDYGFEEGSPEYMELESLALSKVRELSAEKYLNEHGEVVERESFNPETGEVETWEEVHELSDNLRLKKQTILKMMKELGLTPKARSQMDESDANASAAEMMGEVAAEALDSDEGEYDPTEFTDDGD